MGEKGTSALDSKISAVRDLLATVQGKYPRASYANSLGLEAIVLTDFIANHASEIDIFSIDTGRLHEETYELLDQLRRRYVKRIRVV